MFRIETTPRPNWQKKASEYGFHYHTMYGRPYWDESAYYQFSLRQIEQDIEAPTEELHQMCLHIVELVVKDEQLLNQFKIPEPFWNTIANSWKSNQPSLYSRLDFAYDGKSPAKLYENNADTPTSLYEAGFWQWLWLQDKVDSNQLSRNADQFNSIQEKLIERFHQLKPNFNNDILYFSCCKDTIEDRGTVQYIEDCAKEAGVITDFCYLEDIGLDSENNLIGLDRAIISHLFKLYPWEFIFNEAFGQNINSIKTWLEPSWKAILSNKALLPMLWKVFPNHPNLLPAYFEHETSALSKNNKWIKKPIFSREGANISILDEGMVSKPTPGPYGDEGHIYQAFHSLPKFSGQYCLIGSWLVNDKAAGITIREDQQSITQDMSRFIPHIIL